MRPSTVGRFVVLAVACVAALVVAIGEAFAAADGGSLYRAGVSVFALVLVGLSVAALFSEFGAINIDRLPDSPLVGTVIATSIVWLYSFVICLVGVALGGLLGSIAAVLQIEVDSIGPIVGLQRIGAACVVVSLIPALLVPVATALGAKPNGGT